MYCLVILALGATVLLGVAHGDGKTLLCDPCPPGERMRSPCTEQSQTECVPCGDNEYTEHPNNLLECRRCQACTRHHEHESENCTATTNRECECDPGYYLYGDVCKAHTKCPVKYGAKEQGTPTSDTKCQRCESGTFSDVLSSTEGCKDHTDCEVMGLCVIEKGNRRKDNVCGNCTTNGTDVRARQVTNDDADAIAADIGGAWRPLGRRLGFSDGRLDGFENDYHQCLREIVYQMLRKWINENRGEATRGKLADALVEVDKGDVARTLLGRE
ncbi:TNFRSF11B [Branchiostoma lanceolatum]|uniref:Tumor necrosis factor receptor superfamily member 6 n=1 Tax=Branchiostoma lanceolatum TaxID=7740 RepID=A0A8J9W5V9_BRALA|nr:TNFRSF11B [Branchiostoma lanceolatum]